MIITIYLVGALIALILLFSLQYFEIISVEGGDKTMSIFFILKEVAGSWMTIIFYLIFVYKIYGSREDS